MDGLNPYKTWNQIFNNEIIEMLVYQTNLYANRDTNNLDFKVDYDSICKFIGIILFSGYYHVPTINDYWSQSEDLAVPFVANQMSRSRFKEIKKSSSSSYGLGSSLELGQVSEKAYQVTSYCIF